MSEWSEDEAFWEAMEPALCAPGRLALAEVHVTAILACVQALPNARVLDLGCEPGAHAIALARRGHRVTGADTSRRLLDRAGAAARSEGAQIEWVEADMREFPAQDRLAAALVGTSLADPQGTGSRISGSDTGSFPRESLAGSEWEGSDKRREWLTADQAAAIRDGDLPPVVFRSW